MVNIPLTANINNQSSTDVETPKTTSSLDVPIHPLNNEIIEDNCYGFVVPLPSGEDSTDETFQNSKVRHLINDLLRENVTVYWSSCNFSALSKEMNNDSEIVERGFNKGDFIISFSGNLTKDILTTAIIYDYNISSEIEQDDLLKTEIYKLINPLYLDAYPLVEPKIAQHFGTPTRYGWPTFLYVAESGGFLDMEFLLDIL